MEQNTFIYQYSASRNKEVEAIREKYLPKEESKLERLKRLDRKVQNAGVVEGLCLGIVGALVFGIGLCFGLDVFSGSNWLAGLFFALGTALMIPAYPLYKRMARKAHAELAPEILRLSEEIMNF